MEKLTPDNIYETIWNSSSDNNFSVSTVSENKKTDIILNYQKKASRQKEIDVAKKPLFYFLNEAKLDLPIYQSIIALFDNYNINELEKEHETKAEKKENTAFLNSLMETPAMKITQKYLAECLHKYYSDKEFIDELNKIWFTFYTNYAGNANFDCSGFEHIFIGEGKLANEYSRQSDDKISGYHYWLKFYFDEKKKNVDYQGFRFVVYDRKPENPFIISLQMSWIIKDDKGKVQTELFKKMSNFWIGASPDVQMAMATTLFFESRLGLLKGDHRRIHINGDMYDLFLYRDINSLKKPGNHIRSFYPVYKGRV